MPSDAGGFAGLLPSVEIAEEPWPVAVLREFTNDVQPRLGQNARAMVVPGFETAYGRQYRVVIQIEAPFYVSSLFEVYAKPDSDGEPATTNFFGPRSVFKQVVDAAALRQEIEAWLGDDGVQEMLRHLFRMAEYGASADPHRA